MLWQLFWTFIKIGAFTIGGAYAMIPLIKQEVCAKRGWISDDEFMDGLAASQSCPGPIAVNMSIYIGYHIRKGAGMAVAVLGTVIPSTVSIILIATLFNRYADNPYVRSAFHALRPAVVALIAVPLIEMAKKAGLNWKNFWMPALCIVMIVFGGVSPMYLILLTILSSVWQSLHRKELRP